jgi:hypothetical protein
LADQFFAPDFKANLRASPPSLLNKPIRVASASTPIPIQANNLFTMSRQQVLFKSNTEYEENPTGSPSEKTPLLSCK